MRICVYSQRFLGILAIQVQQLFFRRNKCMLYVDFISMHNHLSLQD